MTSATATATAARRTSNPAAGLSAARAALALIDGDDEDVLAAIAESAEANSTDLTAVAACCPTQSAEQVRARTDKLIEHGLLNAAGATFWLSDTGTAACQVMWS